MGTPIPLITVVLFLGIALVWRERVQRRNHGASGIVLFRQAGALPMLRDLFLVALPIGLVSVGVIAWLDPLALVRTGWIQALGRVEGLRAGLVLCSCAVGFIVAAQMRMGPSWRVGIDDGASPGLVTTGPFAFCRNPIFLGMFMWHLGFVFIIPTWGNVALCLAIVIGVNKQVREEEAYLLRTYGEAYRAYAARTGRFLPFLGRL